MVIQFIGSGEGVGGDSMFRLPQWVRKAMTEIEVWDDARILGMPNAKELRALHTPSWHDWAAGRESQEDRMERFKAQGGLLWIVECCWLAGMGGGD